MSEKPKDDRDELAAMSRERRNSLRAYYVEIIEQWGEKVDAARRRLSIIDTLNKLEDSGRTED